MTAFEITVLADHPEWVDVLARWHWDEWGNGYEEASLAEWTAALARKAWRDGIPCTWVALHDGVPCGSATLEDDGVESRTELRPDLAGLFVLPAYRGRGIGSALVRACEEGARAFGETSIYLHTEKAEALYRRLGWLTIERREFQGQEVAIMRRDLRQTV